MKKFILSVIASAIVAFSLPLTAACNRPYDYEKHLSEVKRDLFLAQAEGLSITLSCVEREHPYASDGVTCTMTKLIEIVLEAEGGSEYSVFADGSGKWGGEMSYRNAEGDWFYSQSVSEFPEGSVAISVEKDGTVKQLLATTVKNEHTMSAEEALESAIEQEADYIASLTKNGVFEGEFRVRLLRRDVNYYYVGVISKNGKTLSLLLGAESGKVLARRESEA